MRKLFLFMIIALTVSSISYGVNNTGKATLHMIVFADTEDQSIGQSCEKDYDEMINLSNYIGDRIAMNLKIYNYEAAQTKKEEMLELLNNLKVGPDDAVFFYYSGHGYRTSNSTSPYPRMFVTENGEFSQENQGVSVESVRQLIAKAQPRLSLIMVDACNTMINVKEPETGVSGESTIAKQLQRLFALAEGEAIFCGSEAGDGNDNSGMYTGYSWSNSSEGGFFTYNFREAFDEAIHSRQPASWDRILEDTKQKTIKYSKIRLSENPRGNNVQIPVYECNIR